MANIYKRWLCEESLKTPSSQPILIYFEFRNKPSLILRSFAWTHTRLTNYLRQNIVFSCSEIIRVSFSLFLYFLFLFLLFYAIINFYKNYYIIVLLYFFMKITFIFSFSGMFRDVPECSRIFRNVPCSGSFLSTPTIFGFLPVQGSHCLR